VLFSKGGKPLAVIEAKSTIQNAGKGRKQAIMYADCLEKQYGIRPVIYYTNGYETKVIDGMGYPDRNVISFHSHEDLEYLIQKRGRADITDLTIDDAITNRPYQKTAIKSLVE
jgi:type I restriction enzyme R subunit